MSNQRPDWLPDEQYPFELRRLTLASGPVTYVDEGEGPTLLFVHAGMWSFIFRDVISRLRTTHRCITFDPPGYGISHANADLSIREISRLTEELIESLDLTDATLVLHDLGGPVGLHAAAAQRHRVAGLVLANTFAWTPDTTGLRTMFRVMSSRTMTGFDAATNLVPRLTSTKAGVGRHLDAGGRAAFLGPYADRAIRRRFHGSMRSLFLDPDFTDEVRDATLGSLNDLPVLTIFGEKNDPFGFQDRHAATFPYHEGIIVEDGNHFPMMDDPDLFATTLRSWHRRTVATNHTAA